MRTNWWAPGLLCLTAFIFIFFQDSPFNKNSGYSIVSANYELMNQIQRNVILERMYVDGEVSQETVKETIASMEALRAKYSEWQLIHMDDKKIVFRMKMDDISPLLKANGYFGITEEGVLTIFNGRPQKTNIIQSFFQIDIGRLESKTCEELKKGIPIKTKENFVEVLETFKTYSKGDQVELQSAGGITAL
ncbi:BofC C-terminal domain-containing protein [Cytobacillus praedii]|uniref:BofC C-terminal domain-containing protein n=1 Tax=Cytobacillus praedii TaxID=1742358 RepID=UPI00070BDE0F|nr:BofC C-terminal domain-containing protein [Cytobacillus praedii]